MLAAALERPLTRRSLVRGTLGLLCLGLGAGLAGGMAGCSGSGRKDELNIFIWTEYVPDSVLEGFTKETGIKINQFLFSSNEDMLAKVRTENEGTYDLLQPTDYMVESLIHQGLLEPLDLGALKNKGNIGKQYMDQSFDPGNRYSIPYMGSCTAIAVNQGMVKSKVTKWADLMGKEFADELIALNDFREVLGIAGYTVGLDGNEEDDASIQRIATEAAKFKPNIKIYDSDSPKTSLAAGDVAAGMVWTAEIALAQRDNPDVQVVFPEEGCSIGTDNWCVPKGARHFDNAMRFIDYMLRPEVAVVVSEDYPYVQPNTEAVKLLPAEVQDNPVENVPAEVFERGHRTKSLPPKALRKYDKIWTDLKG